MEDDETFEFDKFMKDIVLRENLNREEIKTHQEGKDELPQRVYNRLYREHWQNRTKWNK